MPIYEYECAACGHRHEILQKIGQPLLRDCPDCGKPELVKLVSAAGFRLAGSGWYETDFKTGSKRNLAAAPDSKGKGEGKGESKTQGKSEGKSEGKGGAPKKDKQSKSPAPTPGVAARKNPPSGGA